MKNPNNIIEIENLLNTQYYRIDKIYDKKNDLYHTQMKFDLKTNDSSRFSN